MTDLANLPGLPPYESITWPQMNANLPELKAITRPSDDEDDDDGSNDGYENVPVIYFPGDVTLTREHLEILHKYALFLAVGGNCTVEGEFRSDAYIKGDLYCDNFMPRYKTKIGGTIVAKHYAFFLGPDDEGLDHGYPYRLDTPFVFAWFYDLATMKMNPNTIVFLLCDYYHYTGMELTNTVFFWHDAIYVLDDALCDSAGGEDYNMHCWRTDTLAQFMREGKSVWREGFTLACMEDFNKAKEYVKLGEHRQAFLHYKNALEIAPGYYPAWLGAGEMLYEKGAYAQALPFFEKAITLFPPKQKNMPVRAADLAAMCAVRLKDPERASAILAPVIEKSLELYASDPGKRYFAFRIRAEASMLQGKWELARADLLEAIKRVDSNATANWLMGRVYHELGEHAKAQEFHARAAKVKDTFNASYSDHANADFVYNAPCMLDWLEQNTADIAPAVQDEAYWLNVIARADNQQVAFKKVPAEIATPAFCLTLIEKAQGERISIAGAFPEHVFTPEVIAALLARGADNFVYIPKDRITKAMVMQTQQGYLDLKHVPPEILDYELCEKALTLGASLKDVPRTLIDYALAITAIKHNSNAMEYVPAALRDEAFYITVVAYGNYWFITNKIPPRYVKPDMLCKAIDLRFEALDAIPGQYINDEVFAFANARHGNDPRWEDMIARHGKRFRDYRGSSGHCAEDCWATFWDEALMLTEIASTGYHLAPYDIPEEKFTQKIADAAFERDPIHLARIPKRFITATMAERFASQYADMLHDVPVALRSARVCEIAAKTSWDNGQYFRYVPKEHRTLEACVTAIKHKADNVDYVPMALHYAVFDHLIKHEAKHFELGWLLNERGLGALMLDPPDYKKALADFDVVSANKKKLFEKKAPFDADTVNDACYFKAYTYHRMGNAKQAQRWLAAMTDPRAFGPLEEYALTENVAVFDFDKARFDACLHQADQLVEMGDHQLAWEATLEAERLLTEAGHTGEAMWAFMLDHKRYISYELGRFDENEALCHEIIRRFGRTNLWAYLQEHNIMRATLRGAYNSLAYLQLKHPPTPESVAIAVGYIDALFNATAPIEDDDTLYPFYEAKARVYHWASALDARYQQPLEETLAFIRAHNLVDDAFVTDETVLALLNP